MATDRTGLYVHIPYCKRKCNYCDFCSLPREEGRVPTEYIDRVTDEIYSYKSDRKRAISTVYFGGGTPSLLQPYEMERIMLAIRDTFDLCSCEEITTEANPGTLTEEKARAYRSLGFNRISLGLQSIHEKEMKKLGRIHNFDDFLKSFETLRAAGFDNINVDLMYGIPYQSKNSFKETLETVASLSPEHISCYGLMVEEGTPFYKEGENLPLPSPDEECDMYALASHILSGKGYLHYEISNYSKAGFESKHNLLYWNTDSYIGIGASAHSYVDGVRRSNTDDVDAYIHGCGICPIEECRIDIHDESYEYAMLRLRLADGFSLAEYKERFGIDFTEGKEQIIRKLSDNGLLSIRDGRIRLTEKGFYVSNSVLVEIL